MPPTAAVAVALGEAGYDRGTVCGRYMPGGAFVALGCHNCAALAKVQPAQPPLRMSSAFPNTGGAVEDTQECYRMERRLQRKFEWTESPAVFAEGWLRLHGAEVELAESVFSSDDT